MHKQFFRVYYEDTDAGGVVYYANYMRFAERGRTEFLRDTGFTHGPLLEEKGLIFVVRRVEADYHSPARLDDLLTVETLVSEVGNSSFMMKQQILREDKLLCSLAVQLVCVNKAGRPVRVPEELRAVLEGHKK